MESLFIAEVVKALATLGPIGVLVLLGWLLWLRFGGKRLAPALEEGVDLVRTIPRATANMIRDDWSGHRDIVRDTFSATERLEEKQEREIQNHHTIITVLNRLADCTERIEKRLVEHDRWERERDALLASRPRVP